MKTIKDSAREIDFNFSSDFVREGKGNALNMKKKILISLLATSITLSSTVPAFAMSMSLDTLGFKNNAAVVAESSKQQETKFSCVVAESLKQQETKFSCVVAENLKQQEKNFSCLDAYFKISNGLSSNFQAMFFGSMMLSTSVKFVKNKFERYFLDGFRENRNDIKAKINELFLKVKGQDEAKVLIQGSINSILDDFSKCNQDKNLKKTGHIIYMVGPSGVGKSMLAEGIAQALLCDHASKLIIDASCVDNKSKKSAKDQLFASHESHDPFGGEGSKTYKKRATLVDHIAKHPKTVVVINEYDKLFDSNIDEVLRTILDDGVIRSDDGELDCSETVFIITSNEKPDCLKTKTKEQEKQEALNPKPNLELEKKEGQDDPNGSTIRKHSASILGRLSVIPLKELNGKSLELVAEEFIKKQIKFYTDPKGPYKIKEIEIDKDVIKNMAEFAQNSHQEARAITVGMKNELGSAIGQIDSIKNGESVEGKTFVLYYDKNSSAEISHGTFILKEKSECKQNNFVNNFDQNGFKVTEFNFTNAYQDQSKEDIKTETKIDDTVSHENLNQDTLKKEVPKIKRIFKKISPKDRKSDIRIENLGDEFFNNDAIEKQ